MIRTRSGYTPKMAAGIFESSNPLMSGSNSQARTLEPLEDVITDVCTAPCVNATA